MNSLPVTDHTRINRLAHRQVTDRTVLHAVLDAGLVAHVAVVRDGIPVVLPLGYARDGEYLLLHGSSGGGLLRAAAAGAPLTATITLLDALVYARSIFDSSMNYRSVMATGVAEAVENLEEKKIALQRITEHLMPGRWDEVRPVTTKEPASTLVLRLPLSEVSVKVRAEGATTDPEDGETRTVWAGVLPLLTTTASPLPADDTPAQTPVPVSVTLAADQLRRAAPAWLLQGSL